MIQVMKKWCCVVSLGSIFVLFVLRYSTTQDSAGQILTSSDLFNATNMIERLKTIPLDWGQSSISPDVQLPQQFSTPVLSSLFVHRNLTDAEANSLLTGNKLKHLISRSQTLPHGLEAIKEASHAWDALMTVAKGETIYVNGSTKEKQCPYYINQMNAVELNDSVFRLLAPCGLTQGSSITIIGTPNGVLGNFKIDLTGEHIPGEMEPPIIVQYRVRLNGDQSTEEPVIVQNSWTAAHYWGEEEQCPSREPDKNKKVDELDQCYEVVGKDVNQTSNSFTHGNGTSNETWGHNEYKTKPYFPFKQRYPFVATLSVGSEGIHMTIDGKHITSFAYREPLEPWLIGEVRISGDVQLISVFASGLPTSEDLEHVPDLESLKSVPVRCGRQLDLFIGVFSSVNNFNRRMAVRRTWMQYSEVRSGSVAVRFFVGLNKTDE